MSIQLGPNMGQMVKRSGFNSAHSGVNLFQNIYVNQVHVVISFKFGPVSEGKKKGVKEGRRQFAGKVMDMAKKE